MGLLSTNNTFLKFGVPFIIFVVAASFGLKEFCQIRYQYRLQKKVGRREAIMTGLEDTGKQMTLESEYAKLKEMDLDNWENKRIPRPWEQEEVANKIN